jgi:hypothetical protein
MQNPSWRQPQLPAAPPDSLRAWAPPRPQRASLGALLGEGDEKDKTNEPGTAFKLRRRSTAAARWPR